MYSKLSILMTSMIGLTIILRFYKGMTLKRLDVLNQNEVH